MEEFFRKNILNNHIVIGLLTVGIALLAWDLRSILIAAFISYIIAAALSPAVNFLISKKIRRSFAVLLVYLLVLTGLLLLIFPLFSFVIGQVEQLLIHFPLYVERAASSLGISIPRSELTAILPTESATVGKNAVMIGRRVFSGFFLTITVVVLSLYFLLDKDKFENGLINLGSPLHREKIRKIITNLEDRMSSWVQGQLTLNFAIGVMTWIGLTLLGVPFALPLAVIAGILEMIPVAGPTISAVPAVIVALTESVPLALTVIVLYIIIQLSENHFLVPKVMQKAVGLNPVVVILGIMIGGSLLGIIGSLLAVPAILVIKTFLDWR